MLDVLDVLDVLDAIGALDALDALDALFFVAIADIETVGSVSMILVESAGEFVDPKKLRPWEKNPRKNTHAVAKVAESITKYGFASPIVARASDMRVIAGHTRLKAALKLNLKQVPVRFVELSDAQALELTLADNKLGEIAEWDTAALSALLADSPSIDLTDLGWSQAEIESFDPPTEEINDPEETPSLDLVEELRVKWRVERGQVWKLGAHRLMCGDATSAEDVAKLLADAKPEIMVTDPPYGVEYDPTWREKAGVNNNKKKTGKVLNDDRSDWREAWALFPGDVAYVYHDALHGGCVGESLESVGFDLRGHIVWAKDRFALGRSDYHWQHEPCWYAVRKGKKSQRNDDRTQSTLWTIVAREDSGHGHSTQKPVECMARPIRNHFFKTVYEPFSGSGTTIIACEQLKKKCFALELSPGYVAVALQRWADYTGKTPDLL